MRRRTVKFNDVTQICVVKRPSQADFKSSWYSKKELKKIRREVKRQIAISKGENFQWRGLERVKTGSICVLLENQQALVQGVLALQKLHRQLGLQDDKAFALFARAYNKEAAMRAASIAKQDFAEALQVYRETQDTPACK